MLDAFWAAPPVTRFVYSPIHDALLKWRLRRKRLTQNRTLTALCLLESIAVYARFLAFQRIYFAFPLISKFPPEVWRLFTSFLLSGSGLGIIFDPYFSKCNRIQLHFHWLTLRQFGSMDALWRQSLHALQYLGSSSHI